MPVSHKCLDVAEKLGNEGQEPGKRISGSVSDEGPRDAMYSVRVITTRYGNEWESILVGT